MTRGKLSGKCHVAYYCGKVCEPHLQPRYGNFYDLRVPVLFIAFLRDFAFFVGPFYVAPFFAAL